MIKRRSWLKGASLAAVGAAVGCGDDDGSVADAGTDAASDAGTDSGPDAPMIDVGTDANLPPLPTAGFIHGVASGDPLADAVILWTRITPEDSGLTMAEVTWTIASDPAMSDVVATGSVTTTPERDWTVKVDATGLSPATTYYYQFTGLGFTSLVGRTKTAPEGASDRLRFVVMSCSSLAHGYFHVYRHVAEMADVDACLHLGDYIYEYETGGYGFEREYEPSFEIVTLDDYRTRYAQYRRDPDLQAVHQQHPFMVIWDDHETANNSWQGGAENHDPETEGAWSMRKAVAFQAFMEWLPVRESEEGRLWRKLPYGDLADVMMLDTRIWGRDEQPSRETFGTDPTLTILGDDQEAWLNEQLATSPATWKVLGQQVMVGQWDAGRDDGTFAPNNLDQWDGYPEARARLLEAIESAGDTIVLTGDIHSHWAMELTPAPHDPERYDPDTSEGSIGVEFVCAGVSSPGVEGIVGMVLEDNARENNPHIKYVNFRQRGWIVLDLTPAQAQADYFVVDGVRASEGEASFATAYRVAAGAARLEVQTTPTEPRPDAAALAPDPPPRRL